MVADYRSYQLSTSAQPRFRSTAVVRGCLRDPDTEALVQNPTGIFSLWRNGALALDGVALVPDPDAGPEYLKLIIAHDELGERGEYKWELVLHDPTTGYSGTDQGRFRL